MFRNLVSHWIASLLYETSHTDSIAYLAAAALLLAIGIAAGLGAALRSAAADPLPALRAE